MEPALVLSRSGSHDAATWPVQWRVNLGLQQQQQQDTSMVWTHNLLIVYIWDLIHIICYCDMQQTATFVLDWVKHLLGPHKKYIRTVDTVYITHTHAVDSVWKYHKHSYNMNCNNYIFSYCTFNIFHQSLQNKQIFVDLYNHFIK